MQIKCRTIKAVYFSSFYFLTNEYFVKLNFFAYMQIAWRRTCSNPSSSPATAGGTTVVAAPPTTPSPRRPPPRRPAHRRPPAPPGWAIHRWVISRPPRYRRVSSCRRILGSNGRPATTSTCSWLKGRAFFNYTEKTNKKQINSAYTIGSGLPKFFKNCLFAYFSHFSYTLHSCCLLFV